MLLAPTRRLDDLQGCQDDPAEEDAFGNEHRRVGEALAQVGVKKE